MGNVAKGKGKTRGKNGKNRKMCLESSDSFQNYDYRRSLEFLC